MLRSTSVVGIRQRYSRPWTRSNSTACLAQPSRYIQSPRIRSVFCSDLILIISRLLFLHPVPECVLAEFQRVGTWEFLDCQSPSAHSLNFSGWALRNFLIASPRVRTR